MAGPGDGARQAIEKQRQQTAANTRFISELRNKREQGNYPIPGVDFPDISDVNKPITGDAWQKQAEISKRMRKIYEAEYRPQEIQTLQEYRDLDPSTFAEEAKATSTQTSQRFRGISKREFERYGSALSTNEKHVLGNFYDNLMGAAEAEGANFAYEGATAVRDDARVRMINIGRGIARSSVDLSNAAAGLQSQREAQNTIAKAQASANAFGNAASLAGLGYGIGSLTALGGPAGAAIGFGISLFL